MTWPDFTNRCCLRYPWRALVAGLVALVIAVTSGCEPDASDARGPFAADTFAHVAREAGEDPHWYERAISALGEESADDLLLRDELTARGDEAREQLRGQFPLLWVMSGDLRVYEGWDDPQEAAFEVAWGLAVEALVEANTRAVGTWVACDESVPECALWRALAHQAAWNSPRLIPIDSTLGAAWYEAAAHGAAADVRRLVEAAGVDEIARIDVERWQRVADVARVDLRATGWDGSVNRLVSRTSVPGVRVDATRALQQPWLLVLAAVMLTWILLAFLTGRDRQRAWVRQQEPVREGRSWACATLSRIPLHLWLAPLVLMLVGVPASQWFLHGIFDLAGLSLETVVMRDGRWPNGQMFVLPVTFALLFGPAWGVVFFLVDQRTQLGDDDDVFRHSAVLSSVLSVSLLARGVVLLESPNLVLCAAALMVAGAVLAGQTFRALDHGINHSTRRASIYSSSRVLAAAVLYGGVTLTAFAGHAILAVGLTGLTLVTVAARPRWGRRTRPSHAPTADERDGRSTWWQPDRSPADMASAIAKGVRDAEMRRKQGISRHVFVGICAGHGRRDVAWRAGLVEELARLEHTTDERSTPQDTTCIIRTAFQADGGHLGEGDVVRQLAEPGDDALVDDARAHARHMLSKLGDLEVFASLPEGDRHRWLVENLTETLLLSIHAESVRGAPLVVYLVTDHLWRAETPDQVSASVLEALAGKVPSSVTLVWVQLERGEPGRRVRTSAAWTDASASCARHAPASWTDYDIVSLLLHDTPTTTTDVSSLAAEALKHAHAYGVPDVRDELVRINAPPTPDVAAIRERLIDQAGVSRAARRMMAVAHAIALPPVTGARAIVTAHELVLATGMSAEDVMTHLQECDGLYGRAGRCTRDDVLEVPDHGRWPGWSLSARSSDDAARVANDRARSEDEKLATEVLVAAHDDHAFALFLAPSPGASSVARRSLLQRMLETEAWRLSPLLADRTVRHIMVLGAPLPDALQSVAIEACTRAVELDRTQHAAGLLGFLHMHFEGAAETITLVAPALFGRHQPLADALTALLVESHQRAASTRPLDGVVIAAAIASLGRAEARAAALDIALIVAERIRRAATQACADPYEAACALREVGVVAEEQRWLDELVTFTGVNIEAQRRESNTEPLIEQLDAILERLDDLVRTAETDACRAAAQELEVRVRTKLLKLSGDDTIPNRTAFLALHHIRASRRDFVGLATTWGTWANRLDGFGERVRSEDPRGAEAALVEAYSWRLHTLNLTRRYGTNDERIRNVAHNLILALCLCASRGAQAGPTGDDIRALRDLALALYVDAKRIGHTWLPTIAWVVLILLQLDRLRLNHVRPGAMCDLAIRDALEIRLTKRMQTWLASEHEQHGEVVAEAVARPLSQEEQGADQRAVERLLVAAEAVVDAASPAV